eukprot:353299-Chlamydomonas_euryale.AAC.3
MLGVQLVGMPQSLWRPGRQQGLEQASAWARGPVTRAGKCTHIVGKARGSGIGTIVSCVERPGVHSACQPTGALKPLKHQQAACVARQLADDLPHLLFGRHRAHVILYCKVCLHNAETWLADALPDRLGKCATASQQQELRRVHTRERLQQQPQCRHQLCDHTPPETRNKNTRTCAAASTTVPPARVVVQLQAKAAAYDKPAQRTNAILGDPLECGCKTGRANRTRIDTNSLQQAAGGQAVAQPALHATGSAHMALALPGAATSQNDQPTCHCSMPVCLVSACIHGVTHAHTCACDVHTHLHACKRECSILFNSQLCALALSTTGKPGSPMTQTEGSPLAGTASAPSQLVLAAGPARCHLNAALVRD